jgi:catechol 2,3-dioxygenase-like lactoylglutathione lyase family enzyme
VLTAANLVAFVSVSDLERAQAFYEGVLELTLVNRDETALVFETRGTELRVTVVDDHAPAAQTVLGWNVADAAAMVGRLRDAGVEPERFEALEQDEHGIWVAPGGARVAWFRDPDGNLHSLAQT